MVHCTDGIYKPTPITYYASSKLPETTSDKNTGLHTNAFNTSIQSHEFSDGKGTITFNGDVTSIGYQAFIGCSGLTSITIPNSVKYIYGYAFDSCSSLTSITIPNSVTKIGAANDYKGVSAFSGCSSLTSIDIPNSVTYICKYAFSGCSSLTSVNYDGTTTQWVAITKDSNWKDGVPSNCMVHCTDGDIAI